MHQFKHPNLFGQSPGKCLLPTHTHIFQKKKVGSGGAKSPRRKPAQRGTEIKGQETTKRHKANNNRPEAEAMAWLEWAAPFFSRAKKNGLRVHRPREAGSNGRYDEFAIAVYRGSRCI